MGVIGMSVDYVVHLAHAYNEQEGSRKEKCREALADVGISIIGGAITTCGAALLLFAPPNLSFGLFGRFILFTSMYACWYCFTLLVPVLMAIGPTGTVGDINCFHLMKRFKKKEKE